VTGCTPFLCQPKSIIALQGLLSVTKPPEQWYALAYAVFASAFLSQDQTYLDSFEWYCRETSCGISYRQSRKSSKCDTFAMFKLSFRSDDTTFLRLLFCAEFVALDAGPSFLSRSFSIKLSKHTFFFGIAFLMSF